MKYIVNTLLVLLVYSSANATEIVDSGMKKITMIMVVGNVPYDFGEFIQVKVTPELPECGDSAPTIGVGKVGVTEAGRAQLYSVALAAAAAKDPIRILYDKSDSNCWIQRIFVHYD